MDESVEKPRFPSMLTAYRVFLLATDQSVMRSLTLNAANDAEAKVQASALMDGHSVELWDGFRFIERFNRT